MREIRTRLIGSAAIILLFAWGHAAFTVYQGKLYLNYSPSVRELWSENIPDHVRKADHNWPAVSQSSKVVQ